MVTFYEQVIGLTRMAGDHHSSIVFFRIGDGFDGHTTVLALFDHHVSGRPGLHPTGTEPPETGARSSLHHIALSLPFTEQDAVMRWYDSLGQPYQQRNEDRLVLTLYRFGWD